MLRERVTRAHEVDPASPWARSFAVLSAVYETERDATLWGQPHRITPALVRATIGDGNKLFWFSAIMTRPNYYLVRVPGEWSADNLSGEAVDLIEDLIEEEFGCADDQADEQTGDLPDFPAYHLGGCSWGEIGLTELLDDIAQAFQRELAATHHAVARADESPRTEVAQNLSPLSATPAPETITSEQPFSEGGRVDTPRQDEGNGN